MRVASRSDPDGQHTVASISISARLDHEFEARWIKTLIQTVHNHRETIGTRTLKKNVFDYLGALNATDVSITFSYPFFVEKLAPVSKEKSLARHLCAYTAKASSSTGKARVFFKIQIPCLTTYPNIQSDQLGGLFGQLSSVVVETESDEDVYPEDIVDIVDRQALAPIYSYLSERDEEFIIQKVHSERRTSVQVTDDVKQELAKRKEIVWFSVRCSNFGMLHSYATLIGSEKSLWGSYEDWQSIGRDVMGI
jgi:GTP cyclohydrolase I